MSRYQHTKGQIKGKHAQRGNWAASGKQATRFFTTGLSVSLA